MDVSETTFQRLYPYLASCKLEITERGKGVIRGFETHSMDETSFENFISCSNPSCRGGIHLSPLLTEGIQQGKTEFEKTRACMGTKRTGFCANSFAIAATVTFKQRTPPGDD
jgi:hypothetical protein